MVLENLLIGGWVSEDASQVNDMVFQGGVDGARLAAVLPLDICSLGLCEDGILVIEVRDLVAFMGDGVTISN